MDTHTYKHTYIDTHKPTTVTLAVHARRGLIIIAAAAAAATTVLH